MPLTLAFVMDPLEQVTVAVDTSFALMLEAQRRGHRVLHVAPADVELHGDQVTVLGRDVELFDRAGHHFRVKETVRLDASELAAVFIRTDPPFDQAYLTLTWMLSFAEKQGVRVINSPRGLRNANEKLYALEFAELCPRTLVSNSHSEIRAFVDDVGGEVIAKPVDGHGGLGVMRLRRGDSNLNAILDLLTVEGRLPIVVQEYLPEAALGDRRLFILGGELRAAVMRVPPEADHRSNVHVGGRVVAVEVTEEDLRMVAVMRDQLRSDGLYFVGIDVIAGKLIEVNVTSPTLVRELRRLGGPDLAAEIIDSVA
jgi:glutathione synthase